MMEEEKRKGEGKRGRKGTERQGKKGKWRGEKRGKLWRKNFKLKGERYKNEQRAFFFCLALFETTWGVPIWKFWGEIFLPRPPLTAHLVTPLVILDYNKNGIIVIHGPYK